MSSIAVQGGAGGTGTVTLLAPSTSTNRTITLPDATTTMVGADATQTLTNKTLTSPTLTTPNIDSAQFATVSGTAPIYPCRAWVNFNGTGTVAIRASGNVSSITDLNTGNYSVNFTTAMPDVNYVTTVSTGQGVTAATNYMVTAYIASSTAPALELLCRPDATSDTKIDLPLISVAIFR